ncbi:outer membrane receptor protein involved in Fe transport [Sphingobium jiangsuense]|uniref:Outer membrane receptor protein involved in Fe transport n=1 Tax=Sphingobium jiangsuense TaxID=870476 RepID=A0A7W6BI04_9SPHN|nr:TonB-dependent receptor [Sphingobium jiangsuense]MBB3925386.1 outer membrane receptor protein involved in Fe transport [Sphingobium jiangsuense]
MKKIDIAARLRCGVAPVILASAMLSPSIAIAQDEPQGADPGVEQVIVVTGSRIARPDLTSNSPISIVSAESINRSGAASVEDVLRDIPQAVPGIGGQTNNGNPGVATIDLRNLTEQRTLVLVDGKRFTPYDKDGIVDVNMIPTALIKRVDVVTGGASAVYGSDAVAGVVNFILDDEFSGFKADAQYGLTSRGDARTFDGSLTYGTSFSEGRGHFIVNGGYTKQKALYQGRRSFSEFALGQADLQPSGSLTDTPGNIADTFPTICSQADIDDGNCYAQFSPNGDLGPVAGSFNFNPYNLFQVPQERYQAHALFKYEFSDAVTFFGRASYVDTKVQTILAPSGTFFYPFTINLDNPFLSDQARGVLGPLDTDGDGNVDVAFGRRTTEIGTRDSIYRNKLMQFVGGFRGDLGGGLNYEVFAQYGQVKRRQQYLNDIDFAKTQQGMLVRSVGGVPTCIDPSNGCVPVNLFGAGNLTPEMGDFIRLDLEANDKTTQFVTGASLAGEMFTLPTASTAAGFAVGVEYRREKSISRPDANLIAGNAPGFGSQSPVDAKYNVKEVYAEVSIPLLEGVAFAESLVFEGGLRYSKYSSTVDNLVTGGSFGNGFSNWTYKAGGEWMPVEGFRVRGLYQRAVRAPNLGELGEPRTPGTGDLETDPCAGANPVGNAALTQLCYDTGVPAGRIGTVNGPIAGQINNYSGGNPTLTPEKSDTYSIGFVVQPRQLPGFSASVDYFNIKVKNAITQFSEQVIVDACYEQEMDPNGFFCQLINRNPLNGSLSGGTETGVDASTLNAASLKRTGIDFAAAYQFTVGQDVRLQFGINATRTIKAVDQPADIFPSYDCVGLVGKTCLRPQPKWQFIQNSQLDYGPLSVLLRWRYIGKLTKDDIVLNGADPADYVVPVIKARSYFDLSSTFDIEGGFQLRGGINNLFDKKPPIVGNDYGGTAENSGNTFPATYDPLGRYFFIGASVKF